MLILLLTRRDRYPATKYEYVMSLKGRKIEKAKHVKQLYSLHNRIFTTIKKMVAAISLSVSK